MPVEEDGAESIMPLSSLPKISPSERLRLHSFALGQRDRVAFANGQAVPLSRRVKTAMEKAASQQFQIQETK